MSLEKTFSYQDAMHHSDCRSGAMLPLLAVVIVILFVVSVLSVDIARIHVTRSELRTATDAAARAAVESLGREQDIGKATDAALAIAEENRVAGDGLTLDPSDIVFGGSTLQPDGHFSFNPGAAIPNAVRVKGERNTGSPDGPVPMMFGPLFGVTHFEPVETAAATRTERDIALVLDVSGSMGSYGRFAALQNALSIFLTELESTPQEERVSLTVYSTHSRKLVDMTSDLDAIRTAFASEHPGGWTAIGEGMQDGLDSVLHDPNTRPFALKSLVVMTDGNWNRGIIPTSVASDCAAANVQVHTVTFSQGANQALMADVATIGGGIHLHADTNSQLIAAFKTIARQLQVLLIE